jgi:putative cell wall-binding protein
MKANVDNIEIQDTTVMFDVIIKDNSGNVKKTIKCGVGKAQYSKEEVTKIAQFQLNEFIKENDVDDLDIDDIKRELKIEVTPSI